MRQNNREIFKHLIKKKIRYASDSERPKQGFDFDYNYRQRMRARAEWEKIQKERKARNDEHAYGHYAKKMMKFIDFISVSQGVIIT